MSNLIVKTGQLSLEVADLDKAVTQAQATIVGMGGSVSTSNLSGTGDGRRGLGHVPRAGRPLG